MALLFNNCDNDALSVCWICMIGAIIRYVLGGYLNEIYLKLFKITGKTRLTRFWQKVAIYHNSVKDFPS